VASLGPFASRFEIEAVLGRGGYGTVVRALDRKQGRKVALKLPHATDAQSLLSIKREFRVLTGVSHPNLVAFHELFVGPSEWFFSMELVRGMDVVQWVERAGATSLVELVRGLALGLAHLHALGILHGDLKPSNAWVDARGTPVLLDFGLARHDTGQVSSERLGGTLGFLAPELFGGASPSPSTDLYAFGVLLVELLTDRPAFEGSGAQIVGRKLLGPPLVIEPLRAGVPTELVAIGEGGDAS
jgi:serine/threonine protein kinase